MSTSEHSARTSLLDVDDSVLLLIDVQPGFVDKIAAEQTGELMRRIRYLVAAAAALHVPVIATVEDPALNGPVAPEIASAMPPQTPTLEKTVFGLVACPEIIARVRETGRGTTVLVGLETDVCVAHSALGLLAEGFRVAAAADATAAYGRDHEFGLERMRDAGVTIMGAKGIYYEWVRSVHLAYELSAQLSQFDRPWP